MKIEYRVTWRREGRQRTTKIFQTWDGAIRKAHGILALEDVKEETSMSGMPDLAERPVLQSREVGAWAEHPVQPNAPSDAVRESVREHFAPSDYGNYGPF